MLHLENWKMNIWDQKQLVLLENRIADCVRVVRESFREDGKESPEYVFELSKGTVERLVKVFKKSDLSYMDSEVNTVEQAYHKINELTLLNSDEVMSVMYPALFFALMLKHETNYRTIVSRKKRKTGKWGKNRNIFDIPSILDKPVKANSKFEEMKKALIKQKAELCRSTDRSQEQKELILRTIEEAEKLLDYQHVKSIEAISKVGLFIRDIFWQIVERHDPLKILLQLYMINTVDGFVRMSCELSTGTSWVEYGDKLLSIYCDCKKPIRNTFLSTDELETLEMLNDLACLGLSDCFLEPAEYKLLDGAILFAGDDLSDFSVLYHSIELAIEITDEEIKDILNCFFNKSRLKWYKNYDDHVVDYVEKVLYWAKSDDPSAISMTMPELLSSALKIKSIQ